MRPPLAAKTVVIVNATSVPSNARFLRRPGVSLPWRRKLQRFGPGEGVAVVAELVLVPHVWIVSLGGWFFSSAARRCPVGEQRRKARDAIAARVAEELPLEVGETRDKLLEVEAGETVSGLQGIKKNPATPSAVAMRRLAERLTVIEATGVLGMDLEWLNRNYQRSLFQYVRNCSAPRLRKLARPRRWTALVCFLRQSYRDGVDQAVDMFDKLLTRTFAHAERDLDQHLREQRKTGSE